MKRRLFHAYLLVTMAGAFGLCATAATPSSPPVDFNHLPWKDGETLTYRINMGIFEAAEGSFAAHTKDGHWEFKLKLGSRGLVDDFYPFTGFFWCELGPALIWRSVEYGEFRFEPKRVIKEQTKIDYAAHEGTREIWVEGKSKTFPVAENAIDDIGTMLYHLRAGEWKPGDTRLIHVYESDSEKEATAQCEAIETRAFGSWPSQPLLRISMLPGKGTHHKGHLMLWMTTDPRHIPVHAELEFRYGTFSIDLESTSHAGGTANSSP